MVMERSKSNRAILAAYSNFIRTLAACGASEPRLSSVIATSSFALDEVLSLYLGSNVLAHQGHVVHSLPGAGARAGCSLVDLECWLSSF